MSAGWWTILIGAGYVGLVTSLAVIAASDLLRARDVSRETSDTE